MMFRCPKCKKVFKRDGRDKMVKGKKSILSLCDEHGVIVRCKKTQQLD
jgi:hypothetical protein